MPIVTRDATILDESLANVLFWIDPSDASEITLNGLDVAQVDDISGNGNNVTQATASKQPLYDLASINGLNSLQFDGANAQDLLGTNVGGGTGYTNITIFLILQSSVGGGYILSKDGAGSNVGDASLRDNGSALFTDQYHSINISGSSDIRDGNPHLATFKLDSTSGYFIYVDGTLEDTDGTTGNTIWNNNTLLEVGAVVDGTAFPYTGNIGEIVILDEALNDTNRSGIERYLMNKWGV